MPTHAFQHRQSWRGKWEAIRKIWKGDWPEMVEIFSRDNVDNLILALEEVRDQLWPVADETEGRHE
jgi:hypothetical protein